MVDYSQRAQLFQPSVQGPWIGVARLLKCPERQCSVPKFPEDPQRPTPTKDVEGHHDRTPGTRATGRLPDFGKIHALHSIAHPGSVPTMHCYINDSELRVGPSPQPFPPDIQEAIDAVMRGNPPLLLFAVLARDRRLFFKFFNAGLLDRGHLTIRQREIVIDRVTAHCGAEYEWGVHVAIYAAKAGLTEAQIKSLTTGAADDDCWSDQDRLLIQLCDHLAATCSVGDELWADLTTHHSDEAMIELLMLAGFYRTVSYLTNALRLPPEPHARRFSDASDAAVGAKRHSYRLSLSWTGNSGSGTSGRRSYRRDTEVTVGGKLPILGTSDPAFSGDPSRWNPEEMLLASIAQCHLLWYLDLAAQAGIVVVDYTDEPAGLMVEHPNGSGEFTGVTLRPTVTITDERDRDEAIRLHARAHELCFIARSVNFPIHHNPTVQVRPRPSQSTNQTL